MANPVLTGLNPSVTFTEAQLNAGVVLDSDVAFSDADNDFNGAKLIVTGLLSEDRIYLTTDLVITVSGQVISYNGIPVGTFTGGVGTSYVVTFNAAADAAAIEALVEHLTYQDVSTTPTMRELHIDILDAAGNSIGAVPAHTDDSFLETTGSSPFDGIAALASLSSGGLAPTFIDVDQDGAPDLIIGVQDGSLHYFHNESGAFVEKTGSENPFDGLTDDTFLSAPTFVDFDGDGDFDLVVGTSTGNLRAFENTGGVFAELIGPGVNPFDGVGGNIQAKPAFGDVDADGDMDLVVGKGFGGGFDTDFDYYRNDGVLGFVQQTGSNNPFDDFVVGDSSGGGAAPTLVDLDGDGDLDLVSGSAHFGNFTFTNNNGTFTHSTPPGGFLGFGGYPDYETMPAFVDLDGDGDLDLLVGSLNAYSGYSFRSFENTTAERGQSVTVNITPPNAAPVIDLNGGGAGIDNAASYTENATPVTLSPTDLVVTDADDTNIESALVQITGGFIANFDYLTVNGDANGTISGITFGYSASTGILTLTGSATLADYQALLRQVGFESTSNDPGASRTIDWKIDDGTSDSAVAHTVVTVTPVNDEPTLTATGTSQTLTEGDAALDLFSAVTASTIEAGQTFTSLKLTVSNVTDGASEVLGIDGSNVALTNGNSAVTTHGTVGVTVSSGTATVTFTGAGAGVTAAELQTLIDGLTYINTSQDPTDANRVVTITQLVDSGSNTSPNDNTATLSIASTVNVDPVNDGPGNTVPGMQTFNEDGTLVFSTVNGNLIAIADADANPDDVTVTLTIADGALTLATVAGLTSVTGNGTANVQLTGTVAEINAALDGLSYAPPANANGGRTLSIVTSDNGNNPPPALQDSDNVSININSVNDAPSGANGSVTGSEDDPYVFQASDFGFSDVADGNSLLAVKITTLPAVGQIRLNGVAVNAGDFIPATEIQAGHLTFVPVTDASGSPYTSFTFQVQDNGTTANGGVDLDQSANTLTINVTPDNLPPVVDLNGGGSGINATVGYTEDDPGIALGLGAVVSDPDEGLGDQIESLVVTLTDAAAGDVLAIVGALPAGISSSIASGGGQIVVTLSGAASGAAYTTALNQVRYSSTSQDPAASGADPTRTVTVVANDGLLNSATATATINVTSVEDPAVANKDNFTTTEVASLSGNLLADNGNGADYDLDGPPPSISAVNGSTGAVGSQITLPSGALLTVNANGTFSYNPNGFFEYLPAPGSGASNLTANDIFTYSLTGGGTATVVVAISGVDNRDLLLGTAGPDTMTGGANDDILLGLDSDDVLFGGAGNDSLSGAAGADTIVGGAGNDVLDGGAGAANELQGGTGDDLYFVSVLGDTIVENAGEGSDQVRTALPHYVLNPNIENLVYIGSGDFNGVGSNDANVIIGGAGNDILDGQGGSDALVGNGGSDILIGGAGDPNELQGGLGNDFYFVSVLGDTIVESAGGGIDQVRTALARYVLNPNIEQLVYIGAGDFNGVGSDEANVIVGGSGNDILDGQGGSDVLVGGAGNDILDGGSGAANELQGGLGDDIYFVSVTGDTIAENAGEGTDQVRTALSDYALAPNVDNLVYIGSGTFAGTGNTTANLIVGGGGNDSLAGLDGDDTLTGGDGNDTLDGGLGADLLGGGLGGDTLNGGAGSDYYIFDSTLGAGNVDLVAGFVSGQDRILLDNSVFAGLADGSLPASAFVSGATAADADDRIIYNSATGELFFDADGSGAGAAMLFATLQGAPSITASDFSVI